MKYECSFCWKLFDDHNDIIILGNGELSCNSCYVKSEDEIEEVKQIDHSVMEQLKKRYVNGEITKEEYTEKMARL